MTDIFLLATGSRGDVQPFVALGYALQQAGYRVEIVSNAMFEGWIRGYALGFRPIAWDPQESMRSQPEFGGLDPRTYLRGIHQIQENNRRVFNQVQSESLQACRDARRLIYSFLAPWGWSIAEKLGIPAIAGALHPVTPTSAFPSQLFPSRSLGGPLNRLSHALVDHALSLLIGEHTNRFRREP